MSPKEAGVIGDAVRIAHRIMQRIDLQNTELGSDAYFSIYACEAAAPRNGISIAQILANQLRRGVYAYDTGMYFSQNPNDQHVGPAGLPNPPFSLPMYLIPEGVSKKPPVGFVPQ
jgi:hypothetical protein